MDRTFSLTLLTLALAGSLCACSNTTSEATPTPDNSPMATPENRSGIVGYGYNGYDNTSNGTWDANNGGMWGVDDAARNAANDMGNTARKAANDVRRGINDVARDVEQGTSTVW